MAGWHHGLDERKSGWTPGDGDGQGGLACCDSWGLKESDMTERLNWTDARELNHFCSSRPSLASITFPLPTVLHPGIHSHLVSKHKTFNLNQSCPPDPHLLISFKPLLKGQLLSQTFFVYPIFIRLILLIFSICCLQLPSFLPLSWYLPISDILCNLSIYQALIYLSGIDLSISSIYPWPH